MVSREIESMLKVNFFVVDEFVNLIGNFANFNPPRLDSFWQTKIFKVFC